MTYASDEYWPTPIRLPEPDPRTPVVVSLDLDLTRSEYGHVYDDLVRLHAVPNLDPHTRALLFVLSGKFLQRSRR